MATVFIDGILFHHAMAPAQVADAQVKISACRESARLLRAELKSAIGAALDKGALATAAFLASDDIILAAAIKANKQLTDRKRAKLERCLAMSSVLNVHLPLQELSHVRPQPKNSGGFRAIHNFGLQHRTAQNLVVRVMECHFVPRHFQYTFLGLHKAIAKTKILLQSGLVHYATLDIKDHFGSFDPAKLASVLPLPKEWVDNVVVGRHLAAVADRRVGKLGQSFPTEKLLLQARQGIPLGGGCSPIVGAYCMAKLPWLPCVGTAILNYADNFLLLASDASELETSIGKLTAAVADLPGGHFQLKGVQNGRATEGFDFLGHHLAISKTGVRTTISYGNQKSIVRKLDRICQKIAFASGAGEKEKAQEHLIMACSVVKGWLQAFCECDRIDQWEECLLVLLELNTSVAKQTLSHLYASVSGCFGYDFEEYSLAG